MRENTKIETSRFELYLLINNKSYALSIEIEMSIVRGIELINIEYASVHFLTRIETLPRAVQIVKNVEQKQRLRKEAVSKQTSKYIQSRKKEQNSIKDNQMKFHPGLNRRAVVVVTEKGVGLPPRHSSPNHPAFSREVSTTTNDHNTRKQPTRHWDETAADDGHIRTPIKRTKTSRFEIPLRIASSLTKHIFFILCILFHFSSVLLSSVSFFIAGPEFHLPPVACENQLQSFVLFHLFFQG